MSLSVRFAIWNCILTEWPYHEPEADTDPDAGFGVPGSEPLADLDALAATAQELLDSFHGPGAAVIDLAPALATFRAMSTWFSRTSTVNYYTPYRVLTPGAARAWVLGIAIAREPAQE
jgi:hypothetical protein